MRLLKKSAVRAAFISDSHDGFVQDLDLRHSRQTSCLFFTKILMWLMIVAAKPRLEHLGGSVQIEYGNYNTLKFAPLGKKSAVRAAFISDSHDGYRQSNNPEDGMIALGARLGFKTQPSDKLSIYVEISKIDQFAVSQYGISSDPEEPAYDPGFAAFEGQQPVDFETELPEDFDVANPGSQKIDQFALRANVTYDFSDNVKLTYRGGYRDISMSTYQALNGYVPETFSFDRNRDFESQSHELRLNGESKKLIWQTGLFRGSDVSNATGGLIFAFARFLSAPAFDKVPYGFYNNWDTDVTTTGVFGQATYNFTDKFAFTGGLRFTGDAKEQSGYSSGAPFGPPGTPVYFYPDGPADGDPGTSPIAGGDETWSQVTWLANFEYKPDNNTMHFAKISTGYKSGGFAIAGPYNAENLTAFEIGTKNRLSERFRLNASAFYFDYRNQQIPVFIDVQNGFAVTNAGESTIFGVELEGDYAVTADGRFDFNINYLNAELTNFTTEVNLVNGDGISKDLSGNRPAQAPEWVLTAGYTHDFALGTNGGTLKVGLNTMFKSDYYLTPFNNRMDQQGSYTRTNMFITYNCQQ